MEQFERLKQIIEEDKNTYTMEEIVTTFYLIMRGYEKTSKMCKRVKEKLTKEEWNGLVNGITMSFFMSLHSSKLTPEEALKLADTEGVCGVAIASVKKHD